MFDTASEREEEGNESSDDGEVEKSDEEENEQRPRSSFSGFSGVVPTQITAPAREPREEGRLNEVEYSAGLRQAKRETPADARCQMPKYYE